VGREDPARLPCVPTVHVPPPYRGPTGGEAEIPVEGATVRECIDAVEGVHPGFAAQVLGEDGKAHRFVRLFVNGEPAELDQAVGASDSVEVLAAIAGGRPPTAARDARRPGTEERRSYF